jgi:alpha-ribazole phosphatase
MIVVLVRHPRPLVAVGVCYGRLDVPLHDDAAVQVDAVLQELSGLAAGVVWSSPAVRCVVLAKAVAGATSGDLRLDARLLELDFGDWEGVAWDNVPRSALDAWAADVMGFAGHGGERGADLVARIAEFAAMLRSDGRDCVVVAHAGPLKLLGPMLRGEAFDLLAPSMPMARPEFVTVSAG